MEMPIEETGRISISLAIDAPEKSVVCGVPEELYMLSDGSVVRVTGVTLTPLSTTICLTFAQAGPSAGEGATAYPIDLEAMWRSLSDERGDMLTFSNLWQAGSEAYMSAEDGQALIEVRLCGPVLKRFPK